jgi:hypothetical protein
MTSEQCELRPLGECELNRISAGRVCDQGGTRMEVSVPFGDRTLVIWATSGSHGTGCSGTYWK